MWLLTTVNHKQAKIHRRTEGNITGKDGLGLGWMKWGINQRVCC